MKNDIYTDLACEAKELNPDIEGVSEENITSGNVNVSRITIKTKEAAEKLGKACGKYVTIDCNDLIYREPQMFRETAKVLADELRRLMGDIKEDATVLICGLGNRYITPDSLGPRVSEKVFVTRHITEYLPDALNKPIKAICSVAPGVLGITGVETSDIICGITEKLKPDILIVTDALASRRSARISTTIQITDTGINPGSGVGNMRSALSYDVLGVPVIALGVPMVVYAQTIAKDTITLIADKTGLHGDEEKLKNLADEVINEKIGSLVVTPKDIDSIVDDMSGVLADGINMALHGDNYDEIADICN